MSKYVVEDCPPTAFLAIVFTEPYMLVDIPSVFVAERAEEAAFDKFPNLVEQVLSFAASIVEPGFWIR